MSSKLFTQTVVSIYRSQNRILVMRKDPDPDAKWSIPTERLDGEFDQRAVAQLIHRYGSRPTTMFLGDVIEPPQEPGDLPHRILFFRLQGPPASTDSEGYFLDPKKNEDRQALDPSSRKLLLKAMRMLPKLPRHLRAS